MLQRKRRFNFKKREKPEFEQKVLDLARVTRVVKGGRRFSFRAAVVIGNRKGKVGLGVAKGADVSAAVNKAVQAAKKNLTVIKRVDSTVSYEVEEKFGAARILIRPASKGRGIVAGGAARTVIELAGIRDVTAKSLGSSSKINVARATIKALTQMKGKEEMGSRRRKGQKQQSKLKTATRLLKGDIAKRVNEKGAEQKEGKQVKEE